VAVHRLGGSAGSYGFGDITKVARALETSLKRLFPKATKAASDAVWNDANDRLAALRDAIDVEIRRGQRA
jgi:HPt (histidine-containing phosphotransfer) domain-containing protein